MGVITHYQFYPWLVMKLGGDKIGIPPKVPEQKYKSWMGNEIRRVNKETTRTSEKPQGREIHMDTMELKKKKKRKFECGYILKK